jgi:ATP-dependent Clp protease ATP-binding subunit ClpA
MFEEYTPEARRVMFFANAFARQPDSTGINAEHLLLALERENLELVNRFLSNKIRQETLNNQIANNKPELTAFANDPFETRFTDAGKRVLSFAIDEATRMSQQQIGIEHLLLGLLREDDSSAARMLRERGADIVRIREELSANPDQPPPKEERARREIEELRKILADAPKTTPAPNRDGFFLRYKGNARLAVFGATYEACRLGSPAVKPEHLLLCVLKTNFVRFKLFLPLVDSRESVCKDIEERIGEGKSVTPSNQTLAELPPSDECQRVLNYAQEEATLLGSEYVTPEHLLLGMLREKDSYAAAVLRECGAEFERIRRELAGL